jgi:YggT family protein
MRSLLAQIISFIVDCVVWAFLIRLLLQLFKADARIPLLQSIIRLTNPIIRPLRKALPAVGLVDTASLLMAIVSRASGILLTAVILGQAIPAGPALLATTVVLLVHEVLTFLLFAVILWAVLSWVTTDTYTPAGRLIGTVVEPLLRPLRRVLPRLEGLDLAPLLLSVLLVLLLKLLNQLSAQLPVWIG